MGGTGDAASHPAVPPLPLPPLPGTLLGAGWAYGGEKKPSPLAPSLGPPVGGSPSTEGLLGTTGRGPTTRAQIHQASHPKHVVGLGPSWWVGSGCCALTTPGGPGPPPPLSHQAQGGPSMVRGAQAMLGLLVRWPVCQALVATLLPPAPSGMLCPMVGGWGHTDLPTPPYPQHQPHKGVAVIYPILGYPTLRYCQPGVLLTLGCPSPWGTPHPGVP